MHSMHNSSSFLPFFCSSVCLSVPLAFLSPPAGRPFLPLVRFFWPPADRSSADAVGTAVVHTLVVTARGDMAWGKNRRIRRGKERASRRKRAWSLHFSAHIVGARKRAAIKRPAQGIVYACGESASQVSLSSCT